MKQTAVEWLGKELESYGDPQFCKIEWDQLDSLIEQAKAMEKEQITEAHTFGYVIGGGKGDLYNPEQYYNETFKSE